MTALSPMAAQPVSPTPHPIPAQPGHRDAPEGGLTDPAPAGEDRQPAPPSPGRARRPETPAGPSLSPSRAADFKTCPLLFRFRTVDKLPETPSADQIRGTLVHAVLERLFDLPAADRTPEAAAALVTPEWERLVAQEPELAAVFAADPPGRGRPAHTPAAVPTQAVATPAGTSTEDAVTIPAAAAPAETETTGQAALIDLPAGAAEATRIAAFLAGARDLLAGYFAVEDPRRLQPAERETLISTTIGDDLLLRGYIDRLDVSPAGDMRVVDYKTGGAPREAFEGRALFQLKFYALVLWRARGVVPRALRLVYLKDAEALDYSPDPGELERFERMLIALSAAIERAKRDRDFRPKPSRLCGWCSHQALCPEFGGTPPPFPELPVVSSFAPDTEPDRVGTPLRDGLLG